MRYAGAILRHSESTTYELYETPRRESKTEQGDDRSILRDTRRSGYELTPNKRILSNHRHKYGR